MEDHKSKRQYSFFPFVEEKQEMSENSINYGDKKKLHRALQTTVFKLVPQVVF
jgi:hypothetical protein